MRTERHIPIRRTDLVTACASDERLDPSQRDCFLVLSRILGAILHFEYHETLERMKDCYAPFDPAHRRSPTHVDPEPAERRRLQQQLVDDLRALVEAANYEEVSRAELERALTEDTLLKIRLHVDFDDYDEIVFFRRGVHRSRELAKRYFGLRREELEFETYERVLVYVKFREPEHFDAKRRATLPFEPGSTVIKLFQDVPRADLEMLLPNTVVRMRTVDKVVIGVPAVVSGIVVISTKLLASLSLILLLLGSWLGLRDDPVELDQASLVALGASLAAVGGYMVRQLNKFKSRKIRFMKALSDNLYFKNLDNDVGVFHKVLDSAEEEECKEALVAYFFLLTAGGPLDAEALDRGVEEWFADRFGLRLDFEIHDALGKLERLRLVDAEGGAYRAVDLRTGKAHLDEIWDAYFEFAATELR